MPTINVSLFAISGNYHEHSNTFITKLDSFILQRYRKFTKQYLNLLLVVFELNIMIYFCNSVNKRSQNICIKKEEKIHFIFG